MFKQCTDAGLILLLRVFPEGVELCGEETENGLCSTTVTDYSFLGCQLWIGLSQSYTSKRPLY